MQGKVAKAISRGNCFRRMRWNFLWAPEVQTKRPFPQCTGDTGEPACTCGKCGSSLYFHAIWSFPRRLPILRPHPGSLRSPTSGLSEGMPASPAQGKACTIPCVPATNEAACIRQVPSQRFCRWLGTYRLRVDHRVSAKLHPQANQSTVSPPGFPTRVPRFGCTEKSLHRSGFFSCVSGRIRSNHVESSRIRPLNFCYASVQKRRATSAAVAASAV